MVSTKKQHIFKSQNGFTLMEVLIAISLLSLIMLSILSITDSSQNAKDRVTSEDNNLLQVETAFSRFEWDFNHIYSPMYFSHAMEQNSLNEAQSEAYNNLMSQYSSNQRFKLPSYEALPIPLFTLEDKNTFTFFTMANRRKFKNTKQSKYAWMQYSIESIEKDEDIDQSFQTGKALVRKVLADDVYNKDEIRWDNVKSQTLLRNIEKMVYEFWNPETKKWVENLTTVKDGKYLIKGIKLSIDWIDINGFPRKFIRVFTPLFPNFTPENMYKIMNQTSATLEEEGEDEE